MDILSSLLRCRFVLAVVSLSLLCSGCGPPAGPGIYQVSGKIPYAGKPIPAGSILFAPDSSQGNSGPGAAAEIVDGLYRTRKGKGVVGGAYIVEIRGFDGVSIEDGTDPFGSGLFEPYEQSIEFPMEDTTQDFDVPLIRADVEDSVTEVA